MRLLSQRTLLGLLPSLLLPGLVAVTNAAPMLRLSSTSQVAIDVAIGGTATNTEVQIYNAGDGSLSPTFVTSASWLTATAGTSGPCGAVAPGSTCTPVDIAVNAAGIAAGTYTELISVSDPNAVDSPQTISIAVNVLGVPASIVLYASPNGGKTSTIFSTQSPVSVQPSTATGGNWLAVGLLNPSSFSVFYPYRVDVTTQSGQAAGDYNGSIVVAGSNQAADNKTVGVLLHVTSSPILSLKPSAFVLTAEQGSTLTGNISIANAGQGSLAVSGATATYTNGSGWLSATVSPGGGNLAVTVDATSLTPGTYQGTVTINSNAANTVTLPVTLAVTSQTGPLISFHGVVNIGDSTTDLAPGDIASVYGTLLTGGATPVTAPSLPLPTNLGGVQVLVNGTAAGLFYVSNGQINFQVPYESSGSTAVVEVVNNNKTSNMVSAPVATRQPRILQFYAAGSPPVIVDYSNTGIPTTLVTGNSIASKPAHGGDVLVLYAVGLGQTTPAIADLVGGPGLPILATIPNSSVRVTIGGLFQTVASVTPAFVGLAPGFASLYQINFTLPQNVPTGNFVGLSFTVADGSQVAESNNVSIAIQ